jgi:hypothetical protein
MIGIWLLKEKGRKRKKILEAKNPGGILYSGSPKMRKTRRPEMIIGENKSAHRPGGKTFRKGVVSGIQTCRGNHRWIL